MKSNFKSCKQCRKEFAASEVYRIGIKDKGYYCRECANNIKSCCMWCGKELKQKKWEQLRQDNRSGKLEETIDRDNLDGKRHHHYYLICEEKKEHGIRPNKSCPSQFNNWWVEKGNQKRQEKLNKGWKECQGKAIYCSDDPATGRKEFSMDCWKLVPPGEKYCKNDCCVYFTAVYNGVHSEERKRIADKWNKRDQEKYQKANDWWNSLSLEEKQVELKAEETKLQKLGLQRQRCWIKNWLDKNSILFENDKLYYDNMNKIPPSFLDRFGLPGFRWESVWKNDNQSTNYFQVQAEIDKEINSKIISCQQAKKNGESRIVAQLEQQIGELKAQQKDIDTAKPTNNYPLWIGGGIGAILLIGIGTWLFSKNKKKPINR